MKKYIITACILAGLLTGCEKNMYIDMIDGGITVSLETDSPEIVTKADKNGVDDLNENYINSIHYYLFDKTTGEFILDKTQSINEKGSATLSLSGITSTDYSNIFSTDDRKASTGGITMFVVANIPSSVTLPTGTGTTLATIKNTAISMNSFGKQDSFVMTGEGFLKYTGSATKKTAETVSAIKLSRVAAKFTIHINVKTEDEDGDHNIWSSDSEEAIILIKNLEWNGQVGGKEPSDATKKSIKIQEFNATEDDDIKITSTEIDGKDYNLLENVKPIYSYPREWSNGDTDAPYIYIIIPWTAEIEGVNKTKNAYYKFLIPDTKIQDNHWYDITANLGGLGSFTPEDETIVTDLHMTIDSSWKDAIDEDHNNTDAEYSQPRVLSVPQKVYTLYNEGSVTIPFISSHPVGTAITVNITKYSRPEKINGTDVTQVDPEVVIDNTNKTIKFTHTLNNDQGKQNGTKTYLEAPYDFQEFQATFTIKHATGDDSLDNQFQETITIIQRPALCVTTEYESPDEAKSNIFVDKYKLNNSTGSGTNPTYHVLGTSRETGSLIYVSASVLSSSTNNWIIGDVRSRTDNIGESPFDKTSIMRGTSSSYEQFANQGGDYINTSSVETNHHLEHYYKAREDSDNIIAPSFIIASAYPGVSGKYMNYQQAELRCASFQEAGYPAGRWRLPSKAEMNYIFNLQLDGLIDEVFDASRHAPYICANGKLYKTNSTSTALIEHTDNVVGSVRCVYDSWYWDNTSYPRMTNKSDWNRFTWGDDVVNWE